MGRGKRQLNADREAVLLFANALSGGAQPNERSFSVAEAAAVLDDDRVRAEERGIWLYLLGPRERDYQIVGKYLFFAPVPEALLPLAKEALLEQGFHHGKLSRIRRGYPNHVLCLYWQDGARLEEMRALAAKHGLDYGGWKTDAETRAQIDSHGYSW
jgi:hypothetical protein